MRAGIFDIRIFINPPNLQERELLLKKKVTDLLISDNLNLSELAQRTRFFSGADLNELVESAKRLAFEDSVKLEGQKSVRPISMEDFLGVISKNNLPSLSLDKLQAYGVQTDSIT